MDEIKVKTINDIISVVDSANSQDYLNSLFVLNGNFIDVAELINRYNLKEHQFLHYKDKYYYIFSYKDFKECGNGIINTFATGPTSMYGHTITKLNINNINVEIRQSPKSNYENRFVSQLQEKYNNENYVVLDIETTGLDPLVDDIIQICIYESDAKKYVRYLPLEKQKTNKAKDINRISNETLKTKKALIQSEVDELIKRFDLKNKTIMIWTGKNLFDRLFLEIYFKKHELVGLEHFKFFNAKTLLDEYKDIINTRILSKDYLAKLYEINYSNSHDALEDCKIEKELIVNFLNKNIDPLLIDNEKTKTKTILTDCECKLIRLSKNKKLNINDTEEYIYDWTNEKNYFEYCDLLKRKYGPVMNDYDKSHIKRGKEWIDIHHIDEYETHNIAVRTQLAINQNNSQELKRLYKYNKHDRLVYANKVEHFLLHVLLDIDKNYIEGIYFGGVHFSFGDLVRLEIGTFEKDSIWFELQNKREEFYKHLPFEEMLNLYILVCRLFDVKNIMPFVEKYWKINEYKYDINKFKYLVKKINTGLK